jgi:Peptidase family M48
MIANPLQCNCLIDTRNPMMRVLTFVLLALAMVTPLRAQGEDPAWVQDRRLASVAERMLGANVALCRSTMPLTGMILHSADQYQAPREGWFDNGPVAVAQVLPGSTADHAGVRSGDGVVTVGGQAVDGLAQAAGYPLRDAVFDQINRVPSPLPLQVRRAGRIGTFNLAAPLGCRALVEVLVRNDKVALSDGRVIQISYPMAVLLDDNELAVVFAHELAHLILEHNRRLTAAGVPDGLAQEFGRNRRLARQAEVEADRLSVHLLANAEYDPQIAPQLWEGASGRAIAGDLLRSRRYPSRRERARLMRQEIAEHLAAGPAYLLAGRDQLFEE